MKRLLCMLLVGLSLCARAQIRDTLIISQNDVTIELDGQGYHHIYCGDEYIMDEGAPELPVIKRKYYIPQGTSDLHVGFSVLNERPLVGSYNIYPSQGLTLADDNNNNFITLDSKWLDTSYPIISAELSTDDYLFGYHIATINIYPLVYNAENQQLSLRDIEITIDYTESIGEAEEIDTLRSAHRKNLCYDYVHGLVDNPELMELYEVAMKNTSTFTRHVPMSMFQNGHPYPDFIIITNEELKSTFAPLAEWKTRRGVYTIIETVEYINSAYQGLDLCEKIRNYIIEKENEWGEGLAILLGGGIDIIPSRIYNGYEGVEATDIYYVDRKERLPNQNNSFSSVVINSTIGRFPVDNVSEAQIMVEKTIGYEKAAYNIDYSYINNNLLADGYISVSNGYCYNGAMKSWYQSTSNYDKNHWYQYDFFNKENTATYNGIEYSLSTYNTQTGIPYGEDLTRENFISALTEGRNEFGYFHLVMHLDHSTPLSLGTSNLIRKEDIYNTHVKKMPYPLYYYQVMFSMGCHAANFTTNCIAKEFLMKPNASAVCFIGNTDVGYASEEKMLSRFYEIVYGESCLWDWNSFLGAAWLNALYSSSDDKCKLHLLGDPTLAFWTDAPVEQANQITKNNNTITLSRSEAMRGKGATVCVHKRNEIYMVDTIRYRESISFSTVGAVTSGYVYITSTGLGQKPQTDSIYIDKGEDNLIEITGIEVTDDDFANDGIVSAGEYGVIKIGYKVLSDEPIDPSKFFISCSSSYIDIESSKRRIIGTNQLIFPFQAKGGTPELNEHNCNAPLVYLYYSTGDKVLCIDCFHISVAKLKGEVRDVSYNLLSNTNGYEYKIDVSYYLSSRSLAPQSEVRLKNISNIDVLMIDSVEYLSSEQLNGNSFSLSFIVRMNDNADKLKDTPFEITLQDIPGNIITHTIYPFTSIPQPIESASVNITSGDTYIDLSWPKEDNCGYYIYTSENNNSYVGLNERPVFSNFFRHENLNPQKKYYYKIQKDINHVKGRLSNAITATTLCRLKEGYPKLVENMGAFRGLVNTWDINFDGKKEIFAGCWDYMDSQGEIIAVNPSCGDLYNENDIHIIERFAEVNSNFQNGIAVGELHDDGEQYIVGSTYNDALNTNNGVYCYSTKDLNEDGNPDLYWEYESSSINAPRSPIIADLDGDDINEVIVPSRKNVTIFEADGRIRKVISCNLSYRHIAVANIIPNSNEKQLIIPIGNTLSVYDKNGKILSDYCVAFTKEVATPIVCDYLCHEHNDVIVADIVSSDSIHVYLIDYSGGEPVKEKLFSNTFRNYGRKDAAIIPCDLTNDGLLELVSLGHAQLIIFDYDNPNNIIKKNLDRNHSYNEVPIIADIDGDNYADVIYQVKETNDGYICAIDRNGNEVGSINLYTYGTTNDGLIAADVDNDGLTEIVTGTGSARFYIWETKGNASCIEWGSARGNAQNTGEYGLVNYPYLINNTTDISSNYEFEHDIYIVGGSLDITGNLTFPSHRKIVVWENGVLNINDATLNNACIIVKSGGKVNITNGSTINLRDEKSLVAPKGARLNILQGVIK